LEVVIKVDDLKEGLMMHLDNLSELVIKEVVFECFILVVGQMFEVG